MTKKHKHNLFAELTQGIEELNSYKDGNIAQYINWAESFPGIGRAKVFPLEDGDNTVEVSVLSTDNLPLGDTPGGVIMDSLQTYLDPASAGLGEGVAPIGAIVTVTTATAKDIVIVAECVINTGYTLQSATDEIEAAVTLYLAEVAYKSLTVNYYKIGSIILDQPSVASITSATLRLNTGTVDITLGERECPVLDTLTITKPA